ncbi:hypothetical protein Taro_034366, partial [Colocasia esculenta]|nr:hypothetical protein [Colocasia esculenta]
MLRPRPRHRRAASSPSSYCLLAAAVLRLCPHCLLAPAATMLLSSPGFAAFSGETSYLAFFPSLLSADRGSQDGASTSVAAADGEAYNIPLPVHRVIFAPRMEEKSLPLQKWRRTEKVPCDFCDEEATVLFCHADSAKLCFFCDQHVHSANALSRKHQHPQICNNCGSFWLGGFPACPSWMRMTGWKTYRRPDNKPRGHGVGWSPIIPYIFKVPGGWDEVYSTSAMLLTLILSFYFNFRPTEQ